LAAQYHAFSAEARDVLGGLVDGTAWKPPACCEEQGFEGLVAKRLDSPYEPGLRSGA
jgi:hypothetical protein